MCRTALHASQHRDGLTGLNKVHKGHAELLGHLLVVANQVRRLTSMHTKRMLETLLSLCDQIDV